MKGWSDEGQNAISVGILFQFRQVCHVTHSPTYTDRAAFDSFDFQFIRIHIDNDCSYDYNYSAARRYLKTRWQMFPSSKKLIEHSFFVKMSKHV